MIDNNVMADIITEFVDATVETLEKEDTLKEVESFYAYNNLGVPLAISVYNNLCELKDEGKAILKETWSHLCILYNADPEGYYETLEDLEVADEYL